MKAALVTAILLVLACLPVQAANYDVANESQLDAALSAAQNPGDTITLTANLVVSTSKQMLFDGVTLQSGAGGPYELDGTLTGNGVLLHDLAAGLVRINANNCTVRDLILISRNNLSNHARSAVAVSGDNATVENCDISSASKSAGVSLGVYLIDSQSAGTAISNCRFHDNLQHINVQQGNADITITGCDLEASSDQWSIIAGVVSTPPNGNLGTSGMLIRDCTIAGARLRLSSATGEIVAVSRCVFTSGRLSDSPVIEVNSWGEVQVLNSLFYGRRGIASTNVGANAVAINNGTCTIDSCTIVADATVQTAAAIRQYNNGTLLAVIPNTTVTNCVIYAANGAGQPGLRYESGGPFVSNHNNIFTRGVGAQYSGTILDKTGDINSPDVYYAYEGASLAGGDLRVRAFSPSATASSTGGLLGYDQPVHPNRVLNSSFEDRGPANNASGWTVSSGSFDGVHDSVNWFGPVPGYDRTYVAGNAASGGTKDVVLYQQVPATVGNIYTASAFHTTEYSTDASNVTRIGISRGALTAPDTNTEWSPWQSSLTGWTSIVTPNLSATDGTMTIFLAIDHTLNNTWNINRIDDVNLLEGAANQADAEGWNLYR